MKNFSIFAFVFLAITYGSHCKAFEDSCMFTFEDQEELDAKQQRNRALRFSNARKYCYSPLHIAEKLEKKKKCTNLASIISAMKTNKKLFPECTWSFKQKKKKSKKILEFENICPVWIQFTSTDPDTKLNNSYRWCWNTTQNTIEAFKSTGFPTKNSIGQVRSDQITVQYNPTTKSSRAVIRSPKKINSLLIRCIPGSPENLAPINKAPAFIDHEDTSSLEITLNTKQKPASYNWSNQIDSQTIISTFTDLKKKCPTVQWELYNEESNKPLFSIQFKNKKSKRKFKKNAHIPEQVGVKRPIAYTASTPNE